MLENLRRNCWIVAIRGIASVASGRLRNEIQGEWLLAARPSAGTLVVLRVLATYAIVFSLAVSLGLRGGHPAPTC